LRERGRGRGVIRNQRSGIRDQKNIISREAAEKKSPLFQRGRQPKAGGGLLKKIHRKERIERKKKEAVILREVIGRW